MNKNTTLIGIFIGQAPPEKEYTVPFARTRLYKWFSDVGIDKNLILNQFKFDALVGKFPGKTKKGHNVPTDIEITKHLPSIIEQINDPQIKLVVPIGALAISYVLSQENIKLSEIIGNKFTLKPFNQSIEEKIIIPLPHPSGLSTWIYKDNNKALLESSLKMIKEYIKPLPVVPDLFSEL